ncbi:hypothetical protein BT69DRAFT_373218 [Atractiella rhizophila]|nr:hypothetical protein BT69DRAFT_373218 [Atractiella rhizophila]
MFGAVGQSPDVSGTTAISQSNYQCLDLPASSNLSLHATTNERTAVEESSQQNKDPVPEIGHFQLNQTSMVSDSPSLPPLLHPTIHQNAFMVKIRAHQRVPGYIQLGLGEDLFLRVEGSRLVPLSASKYSPWDVNHILLSQHLYPCVRFRKEKVYPWSKTKEARSAWVFGVVFAHNQCTCRRPFQWFHSEYIRPMDAVEEDEHLGSRPFVRPAEMLIHLKKCSLSDLLPGFVKILSAISGTR